MTVVARLAINDFPLLIGDVLLSNFEVPGQSISLPTVGNVSTVFPTGSGFVPSGLTQKIAILGENVVIGWAGNRSAAQTVIRELIEKNNENPFSLDSLTQHFEALDQALWEQGLGFVGFLKDARGVAQFGFRHFHFSTSQFGHVGLLGTGNEHFGDLLEGISLPQLSREANDLERALGYGLIVSGVFLSSEIATYQSLLNYFGGGYEIASLINGKFQKLDDITYLFWYGEITVNFVGMNLHQVCKYSYVNDALLIRAATLSKFSKDERLTVKRSIDVVPPIYRDVAQEEFNSVHPPAFDSNWLCSYFFTPRPNGGIAVFADVHCSVEGNAPIKFIEKEDQLIIGFEGKRLESIIKQLSDSFGR